MYFYLARWAKNIIFQYRYYFLLLLLTFVCICMYVWVERLKHRFSFHRRFYLEIKKGQEVERVCGIRNGLTVVWEGPSLHLRYHSDRWTSLSSGFKAQYHILNRSLTEGQFNYGKILATFLSFRFVLS